MKYAQARGHSIECPECGRRHIVFDSGSPGQAKLMSAPQMLTCRCGTVGAISVGDDGITPEPDGEVLLPEEVREFATATFASEKWRLQ